MIRPYGTRPASVTLGAENAHATQLSGTRALRVHVIVERRATAYSAIESTRLAVEPFERRQPIVVAELRALDRVAQQVQRPIVDLERRR